MIFYTTYHLTPSMAYQYLNRRYSLCDNTCTHHIHAYSSHTIFVHMHTRILVQGIGDSGQGAVNAMLFVFFTKRVRHKLLPCCYKDPLFDKASLQASSINAGNTSVHKYLTFGEKSAGTYIDPHSASDSD